MRSRRELEGVRAAFQTLFIVAIIASVIAIMVAPLRIPSTPYVIVLPLMALLAEFIPVQLSKRGVRIAFTLPYVAALNLAAGPIYSLTADILVTLTGGLAMFKRRRRDVQPLWMGINAAVAATSCALGAIAMSGVKLLPVQGSSVSILGALAFMAAYALSNLALVSYVEARTLGKRWSDSGSLGIGLRSLALYGLIGMAVAALVYKELYGLIPLTIVPVWALRTGFEYQARMYDHYYETITALTLMLQRAHPYTHGHLERVSSTAEEVARKLGLPAQRARLVKEAAVLHDIGKIAVNEEILDKPAKLSTEEMDHVRKHASWGAEILKPVSQFSDMIPWILHHHERPDGTGYPMGLPDDQIPVESKIIAVVDAYDAMTGSDIQGQARSYRPSISVEEALAELDRCSGTQFDARVVKAFKEVIMGGAA